MEYQNYGKAFCIPQGKIFMKWEEIADQGSHKNMKN